MKKIINQAKEMKLISDIVWGWDLGKLNWTTPFYHWLIILILFKNNFLLVKRQRINLINEQVNSLVGFGFIVPVKVKTASELALVERRCSHFERWKIFGKKEFYYLSEVILHSEYRNTREIIQIKQMIIDYCISNNIDYLYTTAVSDYSRKVFRNKKVSKYAKLIAVKEQQREVYQISIYRYLKEREYEKKRKETKTTKD